VAGDVYRDAFVIPDLLNYLLAGGFLSVTLIPILASRIEVGDEQGTRNAFAVVFRWAAVAIVTLTAVMIVLAEPVARLLFPRLAETDVITVARLTRIALPAQVFFVLGGLLMAYQYAHRRFLFPALAPVIYNVAIIGGGLLSALDGHPNPDGFVWGALAGAAVGSFGLQCWGAMSAGLRGVLSKSAHIGTAGVLPQYLALALPLMVGQSITVLDEQFPRLFGQLAGEGGTAALSFARMLNMLPVGIIAQAAGAASFPFLARLVAGGRHRETEETTDRAVRTTVAFAIGAAALIIATAAPLVRLVYQWGAFDSADSQVVAELLPLFALSIPAWGIHQVVGRWFYAHRRMWLPVLIGTAATAVAIPLTLILVDAQGLKGIAVASTVVMWCYTIALAICWAKGQVRDKAPLLGVLARLLIAGAAAAALGEWVTGRLYVGSFASAVVSTMIATVLSLAAYIGVGVALRVREVDPRNWRRRPS
jgi:putative peptidoglycan lipid II flippase